MMTSAIRESQHQVAIDFPLWDYLHKTDQDWLYRELRLTMDGRSQSLVLNCAPKRELRKKFPQQLGVYFCDEHIEGITGLRRTPSEMVRSDCCRNWASWIRVREA